MLIIYVFTLLINLNKIEPIYVNEFSFSYDIVINCIVFMLSGNKLFYLAMCLILPLQIVTRKCVLLNEVELVI